jgi:hypothetical protein
MSMSSILSALSAMSAMIARLAMLTCAAMFTVIHFYILSGLTYLNCNTFSGLKS